MKRCRKLFQANRQKKRTGATIYFRQDRLPNNRYKKRHRRTLHNSQGRIHQEDINIINIYATNIGTPKYKRKILEDLKKDVDSNTLIIGDLKTPLSKKDRSSKQNINKDMVTLNNVLDQMDLTDIYIEAFIPKKKNRHSFQMHMEHFQR